MSATGNKIIKLAVFGHPVVHSLSPRIHGMFAAATGVVVEYDRIDCPGGHLAGKLAEFRARGGHGCNLTVPLKTEGLALATHASRDAQQADACNTLVAAEDGWHADNTDGAGLVADLDRLGVGLCDREVLVLGAGGAVAGILGPLLDRGPRRICLVNRDVSRAERLAARFAGHGRPVEPRGYDSIPAGSGFDLLLQGTSLGHRGGCPPVQAAWLTADAVAYDLNYGPAFAPFAARCSELGIACHPGLGMLIEQAAVAFELFTGVRPDTGSVHAALAK